MNKKKKRISIAVTLILVSLVLLYVLFGLFYNKVSNERGSIGLDTKNKELDLDSKKILNDINITAKHAVIYDIKTDTILWEKDAFSTHPLASITKVASALVSSEILNENQTIAIDIDSLEVSEDHGLIANEIWSFKDLLDFSLLVSSNDGSHAIANIAGAVNNKDKGGVFQKKESSVDNFVDLMNGRMKAIGLRNTYFNNPSGLDQSLEEGGGYSTAYEVAKLFEYIIETNPNILEATRIPNDSFVSEDSFIHNAQNTNRSYPYIPSLIASKTGYTELAGGNLAVVFDIGVNHPVALVVLESGFFERFDDINILVNKTLEYYSKQ